MRISDWSSDVCSSDLTSAFEPVVVERSSVLPFAKKGRPWNDLSFGWRLAWPFLLFGVIAIGAGAIMAVASELSQLTIRSEEHTSELQSLMRISYAVVCLKKKKITL